MGGERFFDLNVGRGAHLVSSGEKLVWVDVRLSSG